MTADREWSGHSTIPSGTGVVGPYTIYEEPQAFCAHRSGIEHVEVTQPQGTKYEFWRCVECQGEFRPTGEKRT